MSSLLTQQDLDSFFTFYYPILQQMYTKILWVKKRYPLEYSYYKSIVIDTYNGKFDKDHYKFSFLVENVEGGFSYPLIVKDKGSHSTGLKYELDISPLEMLEFVNKHFVRHLNETRIDLRTRSNFLSKQENVDKMIVRDMVLFLCQVELHDLLNLRDCKFILTNPVKTYNDLERLLANQSSNVSFIELDCSITLDDSLVYTNSFHIPGMKDARAPFYLRTVQRLETIWSENIEEVASTVEFYRKNEFELVKGTITHPYL